MFFSIVSVLGVKKTHFVSKDSSSDSYGYVYWPRNVYRTFWKSPLELKPVGADTLEALADLTAEGGIFGRFAVSGGTVTLRSEAEGAGRVATIGRRLFPAAKTIESRYTYLQKRPWLLPVAWMHRVVRTWSKLGGHAAEAKDILSADETEVRRQRRMLREIGL